MSWLQEYNQFLIARHNPAYRLGVEKATVYKADGFCLDHVLQAMNPYAVNHNEDHDYANHESNLTSEYNHDAWELGLIETWVRLPQATKSQYVEIKK